jgi:hypothetical protein
MPHVISFAWIPALLTAALWAWIKWSERHPNTSSLVGTAEDAMSGMILGVEASIVTLLIWVVYFAVFAFIK